MLRGMVFIDHMNFNITLQNFYHRIHGTEAPRIDYQKFMYNLAGEVPNVAFVKGYICVPKPDAFLMGDSRIAGYYKWASSLSFIPFVEVIEGQLISRHVDKNVEKDINNPSTFYRTEKGSDVNFAITALSKAFFNSYDVGFFISADTDYITVYDMIRRMGKTVIQVSLECQRVGKLSDHVDMNLILHDEFFQSCLMDNNDDSAEVESPNE